MAARTAPVAVVTAFLLMALSPALSAQTIPRWPADQEKRLKEVDAQLLDVQRQRFQAIFFSKDQDVVKQLDEQHRSLQKERRALIEATQQH